jgi:hypothetical protein
MSLEKTRCFGIELKEAWVETALLAPQLKIQGARQEKNIR